MININDIKHGRTPDDVKFISDEFDKCVCETNDKTITYWMGDKIIFHIDENDDSDETISVSQDLFLRYLSLESRRELSTVFTEYFGRKLKYKFFNFLK